MSEAKQSKGISEGQEERKKVKPLSRRGTLARFKELQIESERVKEVEGKGESPEIQMSTEAMNLIDKAITEDVTEIIALREAILQGCLDRLDKTNDGLSDSSMRLHRVTPYLAEQSIVAKRLERARRQGLESS